MKARGKREAQRNASPWLRGIKKESTESAKYQRQLFRSFRALTVYWAILPGATRLTLFGACPWLSYSAPSALSPAFIFRAFGAQFRLFVQSRTRRRVFGRVTTQYALYISVPKRFRGASVKSLGKYEVFSGWVEDIQNYNTEAV